jgi:uncharacterized SAM-binding protein YcdF (DUF218 family)
LATLAFEQQQKSIMLIKLMTGFAMLDALGCETTTISGQWAGFTWRTFNWLSTPSQVVALLVTLIVFPWLIRSFRWKRQVSGLGIALLVSYGLLGSPAIAAIGNRVLTAVVPPDSGMTADAIVVLGRGEQLRSSRVKVAADLWKDHRAPLIFASGWNDAIPIAQALEEQGIPKYAIAGEPCSRTTEENAQFTMSLLQSRSAHRIVLVTDPPHMLRSLLTFRSFGAEVVPHPSPLPGGIDRNSTRFLVFREYVGLVSYGLLGRFFPREVSNHAVADLAPALPDEESRG